MFFNDELICSQYLDYGKYNIWFHIYYCFIVNLSPMVGNTDSHIIYMYKIKLNKNQ